MPAPPISQHSSASFADEQTARLTRNTLAAKQPSTARKEPTNEHRFLNPHPTASTFQSEVLQSDQPVLVDFWAPWCPPCRMLKPELEKLATELDGKAKVAMVNVDEQPELAEAFRVSSIPALFIVKNGRPVDAWTGYAPKAAMLERVQKHIG